ncbi:MAG: AMP-binding protein [Acidobacteriota bacterium]|nr:AMP-binding protein [Acidobacteriota bacterium]MDE3191022.1 AMP-binding protein [Acidobacteriota bacterium]
MGAYLDRPWLGRYASGVPGEIAPSFSNALAMFNAAAASAAERPFIHYFGSTITFDAAGRLSSGLAHGLRELGIERGDRVALYVQNIPQFVLAQLAAWKLGAIVVPVNPMLKHRELGFVLNDSGAAALVTLESLYRDVAAAVLPDTPVRVVVTTSELDFLEPPLPPLLAGAERSRPPETHDLLELARAQGAESLDPVDLGPDDVAFLTYTSGTTGPPKGAMNTHGNVVFAAHAYRDWVHLDEDDVVLGVAPLSHITGLVAHIAVATLVPMPVVLFYRFDVDALLDLVERYRATFTVASITAFIGLMNHPTAHERDLSSFVKLYSGGAPIAPATVEAYERLFGTYIHSVYGLTETTSPSHIVPFGARAPVDPRSGALGVGVPTFNTMSSIVDESHGELAVGDIGEIAISGPQVVPGYWNKPDETAQTMPGGVLYTGDVGFMDEDGWFYVVDRKKEMINAAGFKVWPREVEDVLYAHPAVREAAVVGVPDAYRGESVKAFVSLKANGIVDEPELIAFCRERMAAYKYPRAIEILDELPKTPSGKILRRELRDRGTTRR